MQDREETLERERILHETNLRMAASIATVSHELQTSLTVIKGNLKLCEQKVQRSVEPEAPYTLTARELISLLALLGQAKQQIMLEDRLVNDLADISRMQTDRLELLKIHCDLATIVREAVEEERRVSCARTMHLLSPSEQAVPVYADPDRIGQVVTTYLTSARNSSAARPIEVRLEVEEKLARVSVSDAGPGIPALEQELLREAFSRGQGSEVSSGEAVWLGIELYLCRTIIERHHGQVGIQSAPGKGSTFWFTLPLAGQDTPADPVR
jgi:signal transduction histidine kinase